MDGLIVPPGQGRKLTTKAQEVTFKATGAHGSFMSCFEVVVPPGFDVGAHIHDRSKEFFYILEGELDLLAFEPVERTGEGWQNWESSRGDRLVRAGAGSCMFVPSGCPHAFMNPTEKPTRVLFQSYPPPDHERYFEELCDIFSAGSVVDSGAVQQLRDRYDVNQITPLRYGPPSLANSTASPLP
ncbi:MAG TPA: cupin domain-containing protein [Pseudonocardia sp.]|jgi:mannose-6-phosphate isomerase-like protein (cupin superfamily)|uniref:cupin domain-containing protein n=1 Tax=Pseudonocardia sp. TaxID=60912 RepID=UPI002F3ECC91